MCVLASVVAELTTKFIGEEMFGFAFARATAKSFSTSGKRCETRVNQEVQNDDNAYSYFYNCNRKYERRSIRRQKKKYNKTHVDGYISTLHPEISLHSHRLRKATSNIIMKFALAMKII